MQPAREAGFLVHEIEFSKRNAIQVVVQLIRLMRKEKIERLITHSSLDAWMGGIAARLAHIPIVRLRHLSSSIRPGLNSYLLYNVLADRVVTTCAEIVPVIQKQAGLDLGRCLSIPTGVSPFTVTDDEKRAFRQQWGIQPDECLVGTLCVLRGWKGVCSLIHAANLLRDEPKLKWLIVGSGPSEDFFRRLVAEYAMEDRVIFTGHLSPPGPALGAMDIFALCSHSHEGVSQASLQAAWLGKPLLTTPTGGLKEVCIPEVTGLLVPPNHPDQVAEAVRRLLSDPPLRAELGRNAKSLVYHHFTMERMLDQMEALLFDLSK